MAGKWGRTVATLLSLAVIAVLGWWGWASWELSKARHSWRQAYPHLAAALSQGRAYPANDTAIKLEHAAAAMGLNWAPKKSPRFEQLAKGIPEDAETRFSRVRPLFSEWAEKRLLAPAGERPALPAEVEAFLASQKDNLAAIRALLLEGPLPKWEEDLAAGWEAPVPNLLSSLVVTRLLATDAFWQLEHDHEAVAARDFLAIRQLAAALAERSELISLLIAIHVSRFAVIGIRELAQPDPAWLTWIEELDLSPNLERALATEAYLMGFRCQRLPDEEAPALPFPLLKARCAQASKVALTFAKTVRERPCLGPGGEEEMGSKERLASRPDKLAPFQMYPNLKNAVMRLQALHLHAALTREVLRARLGQELPKAGTVVLDHGPCRGVPVELSQLGTSWMWRWNGKTLDLPEAWLPLAATWP